SRARARRRQPPREARDRRGIASHGLPPTLDVSTAQRSLEAAQPLISSSSTSKISVASGGITPPAPRLPYAMSGGMISVRWPPTFIPATPSSQPRITRPPPKGNVNGSERSRDESNLAPF